MKQRPAPMRLRTLALALLAAAPVAGAQTIDTRLPAGIANVSGGAGLYAQTFTAPTGAIAITDFSLWAGHTEATPGYDVRALLFAFDGTRPVGDALATSAWRPTAPIAAGSPGVEETFLTPGVAVTAGATYIAILQRAGAGILEMGLASRIDHGFFESTYAGGAFWVGEPVAPDPRDAGWFTDVFNVGSDLAFVAHFTSAPTTTTPEPGTWALLATGLVGVAGLARRRRAA